MSFEELRSAAAHVFVADLDACVLDEADHHHLVGVLRVRDGEVVSASDGNGHVRLCAFRVGAGGGEGTRPRVPSLEPLSPAADGPDLGPSFTVAVALVKGDRPEWAVQKLTEIGVASVVLFVADRSVVRWDASRRAKATERYARIAREAAMQSRRCTLPAIRVEASLAAAVDGVEGTSARAEPGGAPLAAGAFGAVLIGPEGGWSDGECALVPRTCGLGPTVLRSETAAVVAATLLRG